MFGGLAAEFYELSFLGSQARCLVVCCQTLTNWPQDSSRFLDGVRDSGYASSIARVAELADALALGASAFGRAGSNPALRS